MSADEYWFGDPSMIFAFQQAYMSKEKLALQKLWQQGLYFAQAIRCTIYFGKGKPPQYPEMPFKEENEQELAKDPEWVEKQRILVWNQFAKSLGIKEKK